MGDQFPTESLMLLHMAIGATTYLKPLFLRRQNSVYCFGVEDLNVAFSSSSLRTSQLSYFSEVIMAEYP
jgi:hypothetical protein